MNHSSRAACWGAVVTILVAGQGFHAEARPTQAYVEAGEHGQAVLLSRLGECYAVTPAHVVGDELFAMLKGASANAPLGDGDVLQTFGYDLSILRVTGDLAGACGGPIGSVSALDDFLSAKTSAAVSSVNSDGSLSRRSVTISDLSLVYLRVRPNGPSDQLFKGLSGSPLMVGDRTIGLLMSVDSESGEGRVLRFDRAVETLRPFFGLSASKTKPPEPRASSGVAGTGKGLELQVISWSAPPFTAESRAVNLTAAEGVWLTPAKEFPIELILKLPGGQTHTLDSVRLVGAGVEPAERLIRDFEVLVSSTGKGSWISVLSGTYFKSDTEKILRFAPVRAQRIMLRVYSHWGDPQAVGLSGIEVPATP